MRGGCGSQLTPPPPPLKTTFRPMALWWDRTARAPSAVRLLTTSFVVKLGSLKQGNASGSHPRTRTAPFSTFRLPWTVRSDPPNAAYRSAPGRTVRFRNTVTEPESTAQAPAMTRERYVPGATEPPWQVE